MVDDKCLGLRSYEVLDPSFYVIKLMKDMLEYFQELGTDSANKSQETIMPAIDLLKQSNALDALGARVKPFGASNGSVITPCAVEVAESQIPRFPSSSNGIDDCTQTDKNTIENIGEIDEEKEQNSLGHANPHSLLVQQPDDIKSLHDVNDIAKGQERVVISLVNEVNNECPPSFHYIPKNAVFQNAYVNFSLARIGENCCSICLGDCLSSSTPCACANETGGDFAYTLECLVKDEFLEECILMNRNSQKHCHFYCKECPLERSKNDDIIEPCKGHLVRKFIKECWWKCGCSKQCGNRVVQRGISCNLQLAFFTSRKVQALEELTWDYGIDFDDHDHPVKAFKCRCGSKFCRNIKRLSRSRSAVSGR
ncbi:hypothetical protein ACSBR1_019410 [Camellia fascicularis]